MLNKQAFRRKLCQNFLTFGVLILFCSLLIIIGGIGLYIFVGLCKVLEAFLIGFGIPANVVVAVIAFIGLSVYIIYTSFQESKE